VFDYGKRKINKPSELEECINFIYARCAVYPSLGDHPTLTTKLVLAQVWLL
jgi:hypothetical protein